MDVRFSSGCRSVTDTQSRSLSTFIDSIIKFSKAKDFDCDVNWDAMSLDLDWEYDLKKKFVYADFCTCTSLCGS